MKNKFLKGLVASFALTVSGLANAGMILIVDDSEGQSIQTAWTDTLSAIGHSYAVEALGVNGNSVSDWSIYDAVIWSVGDRAYENLTTANWSTITNYASGGGNFLYAGGHNVYDEDLVGHSTLESFFGITNTRYNMPMWGSNTSMSGTGLSANIGTDSFDIVVDWTGGEWGNMFSGFGTSSATGTIFMPTVTNGAPGPYVGAVNNNVGIWGFDINHIANSQDRISILDGTLNDLGVTVAEVPEPSTLAILALGLMGLASRKFKKQA